MIKNVIFDIGLVLVDWDPAYYYSRVVGDDARIEGFKRDVVNTKINHMLDMGQPWNEVHAQMTAEHPEYADMIDDFWDHWFEMFSGPIQGSVDIFWDLKNRQYPLYALTNWNGEKFPETLETFPFLKAMDGRVVSAEEKIMKPDPRIYQILLDRYNLKAEECLFIDDRDVNVIGAHALGIHAVKFTSPQQLRDDLVRYGVLPPLEPAPAFAPK